MVVVVVEALAWSLSPLGSSLVVVSHGPFTWLWLWLLLSRARGLRHVGELRGGVTGALYELPPPP